MTRRSETTHAPDPHLIEEMCDKYQLNKDMITPPPVAAKVLVADDNVFCNTALKGLIESCGNYQVLTFYNGADVSISIFRARHAHILKNPGTKSA